ncbi:hypothetical protein PUNSTDRAFT_134271 [Punctularia strigosozonata HHB-11173 SS5]|uniref:uncharacterized protein n=1 Tax=Punctularia strigosozonata (strain HHB-11173) TaxID=741275 RepID=UPI00044180F7|nr:uncharacterized protein PUNSTDRAFT_134271 [Punctularia strigosozonata HHB-11173 SS5]EIN09102.1 hypothetical protein PUNSTDRAFT_134271 [Punctularia strigosozonata HHB-11173 SS5]
MADVIPVLQRVQFANYFISASVPLLIYDFCLTLDDEVSLIWGSKLSWIKILYFMNRLAPFSDAILGLARRVLARDEWVIPLLSLYAELALK